MQIWLIILIPTYYIAYTYTGWFITSDHFFLKNNENCVDSEPVIRFYRFSFTEDTFQRTCVPFPRRSSIFSWKRGLKKVGGKDSESAHLFTIFKTRIDRGHESPCIARFNFVFSSGAVTLDPELKLNEHDERKLVSNNACKTWSSI